MVTQLEHGHSYFITDIDRLVMMVTSSALKVSLSIEGSNVLQETYLPAGQEKTITIYEVGELIGQYIKLNDPATLTLPGVKPVSVSLKTVDGPATHTIVCKCYYGRRCMDFEAVKPWFLTHDDERKTAVGRLEYVSYVQDSMTSVKVMVAFRQGAQTKYQQALIFPAEQTLGHILTKEVSIEKVAAGANVQPADILFYDVLLMNGANVADKVRWVNDTTFYRHSNEFLYLDAWGAPATMTMTGLTEYSPELQGEVVSLLNRLSRQDARFDDVRTINTGYLTKKQYERLVDLATSPYLYIREKGQWVPVVIEEIDFGHQSVANEKINATLTIRKAGRTHISFARKPNIKKRIFDKSFDMSFE